MWKHQTRAPIRYATPATQAGKRKQHDRGPEAVQRVVERHRARMDLPAGEAEILRAWVAMGAPWPEEAAPARRPRPERAITDADRGWWA